MLLLTRIISQFASDTLNTAKKRYVTKNGKPICTLKDC